MGDPLPADDAERRPEVAPIDKQGASSKWRLLKPIQPEVFDPRDALNPSLEARLQLPCCRRPHVEHPGQR